MKTISKIIHRAFSNVSCFSNKKEKGKSEIKESVSQLPAGKTATPESPIILNSDGEVPEPKAVEWLYRCIFQEEEVRKYVEKRSIQSISSAKTFRDINNILASELSQACENEKPAVDSLLAKANDAIRKHLEVTAKNEGAYLSGKANLSHSGFWPSPRDADNGRSLYTELPYRKVTKFIDRKTALVSAGSCFAVEIALELQRQNFNYIVTERNSEGKILPADAPASFSESSAGWGILFNNPSFRQLVEVAYGLRKLPSILWVADWTEIKTFRDPFREEIFFSSVQEYTANYNRHIEASRRAFDSAEVLIITLGLNEVWQFKMDGSVFSRSPWRIAPSFVEQRVLTVEENVRELQVMLNILRRFNPGIKVIVSLSPVPLHATFLHEDRHVVEANTHSKSVLRVAAQQFVDSNKDVYYFPSYELITYGCKDPWEADERHVARPGVEKVMQMFQEMFVIS